MSEKETIIQAVRDSECFKAEVIYAERGGYKIELEPRLYKVLEDDLVRVVFPACPRTWKRARCSRSRAFTIGRRATTFTVTPSARARA